MVKVIIAFSSMLTTAFICISMSGTNRMVSGVRIKLFPDEEPTTEQVYKSYRVCTADHNYWGLNFANVSKESADEDQLKPNGLSVDEDFNFNSGDYLQKVLNIKYFVPYDERAALQVYDDPADVKRAAGPRVDQEMCGHHLDYMNHLVENYGSKLVNTTEASISKIMNTYEWPRYGLTRGNNYFLGDHEGCVQTKLNVMRNEMQRLNKTAADLYFNDLKFQQLPVDQGGPIEWALDNLGPFLGRTWVSRFSDRAVQRHKDSLRTVPMRYCMAGIRWPSWKNSSHDNRNVALRVSVCLPETCDSHSIQLFGDKIKKLTDLQSTDFHSGYYITNLYCLPDEQSELRNPLNYVSTCLFILFNIIWVGITLLTLCVKLSNSGEFGKYLDCWSIKKNIENFFSGKKGQGEDLSSEKSSEVNFEALEGLKFIGSLLVILAHAISIGLGMSWNPEDGHHLIRESFIGPLFTLCPTSVDIFFTLTGVLTMYIALSKNRKSLMRPSFWVSFIVYRYIRIVPMYALSHWFLSSTFRFMGSGPLWDYGTSHSAWSKICQDESWWDIFLPQANFKSPAQTCNAVGWYLANDIQFTLITPFIVALYAIKPKLGHALTGSAVLALVANHINYYLPFAAGFKNVFQWDIMTFTPVFHETSDGYVRPEFRVVSYLVGLATGYILHSYAENKGNKWPRWFTLLGKVWICSSLYMVCFMPFLTSLVPLENEPLVNLLALTFLGTMHVSASICIAILILFLCTGDLPVLSAIFSWPGFKSLASASLPVVLIQLPVILYRTSTTTTLPELTPYYLISRLVMWSLEIYILGIVAHLLYEVPMRRFLIKFLASQVALDESQDVKGTKRVAEKKTN